MNSNGQLIIAGLVILLLAAALVSSFLRHLRWEERMLKWRIRIYFHILGFLILVGALAYFYFNNK
jgi:hypothetical protein